MSVLPNQMTLGNLRALICEATDDGITDDAPVFWYLGNDGFSLQAEPRGGTPYVLLKIKVEIAVGGPA